MDNMFVKPEKPFLLMFKDVVGRNQNEWFSDEKEFEDRINEVINNPHPCTDIEAIEIGSCRDIDVESFVKPKPVIKTWGNFEKGDRIKGYNGKGVIAANPIGVGYLVKWDNGKIERDQSGSLKFDDSYEVE